MLIVTGTCGCSSFNRDWKARVKMASPATDLQGLWQGTWVSNTNGHRGRLRCILTGNGGAEYVAHFHANYGKILSFSYTVPLSVQQTNDVFVFRGDADLGRLAGGFYHYEGTATPISFFSTYQAKADGGTFQMQRP